MTITPGLQDICDDCYTGRCHGDPGRCGCMFHPASIRAREAAESAPAAANTTTPAITDEDLETARDAFEKKFGIGVSDYYLPVFREAIGTAAAGVLAERELLAAEAGRLRAGLAAVHQLHAPEAGGDGQVWCAVCVDSYQDRVPHPCRTLQEHDRAASAHQGRDGSSADLQGLLSERDAPVTRTEQQRVEIDALRRRLENAQRDADEATVQAAAARADLRRASEEGRVPLFVPEPAPRDSVARNEPTPDLSAVPTDNGELANRIENWINADPAWDVSPNRRQIEDLAEHLGSTMIGPLAVSLEQAMGQLGECHRIIRHTVEQAAYEDRERQDEYQRRISLLNSMVKAVNKAARGWQRARAARPEAAQAVQWGVHCAYRDGSDAKPFVLKSSSEQAAREECADYAESYETMVVRRVIHTEPWQPTLEEFDAAPASATQESGA